MSNSYLKRSLINNMMMIKSDVEIIAMQLG